MKPVDQLTAADLTAHRVWEFVMDMEDELPNETYVRPVEQLPVRSLGNRVVSALLTLANGEKVLGMLGSLDLSNPTYNLHLLGLNVFNSSGQVFPLARYHDVDYSRHDPVALARFLGLPVDAVFPMRYDISDVANGHPDCIRGNILRNPATRLSEKELIDLAIEIARKSLD